MSQSQSEFVLVANSFPLVLSMVTKTQAHLWQGFHPNALLLPFTAMGSQRWEEVVPMC